MAPPQLTQNSYAPASYRLSHQRSEGDDKLLYALIDWLLPHLRLKTVEKAARWEDFWRLFKADGTMGWEEFEKFLRWDCKLNARKLFELLDDAGTGRISSKTLLEIRREYEKVIDCRHSGLDDLKVILLRKYGNLMRAWRLLFDPECRGRSSHAWFVKSCKEVGFHGDLKSAWSELTCGDVHRPVTMRDLDPETHRMMKEFTAALTRHHGTAQDGWYAVMRAHGAFGRMDPESFDRVCQEMDFGSRFAKKIFGALDSNMNKSVTLDEWEFLALWEGSGATEGEALGGSTGLRANIGAPPPNARGLAASGGYPEASAEASDTAPRRKIAWQSAVGGDGSRVDGDGGGPFATGSDAAAVEFHVILTKEEHKEYLRRRRELETMQGAAAFRTPNRPPQNARGHSTPTKGRF